MLRKPLLALGVSALTAFTLAVGADPALAVDDLGLFELDGNAVFDNTGPPGDGDDWELLCDSPGTGGPCANSGPGPGAGTADVFTGINPDPAPESIFTGGRKDIQEISQWGHKNGAVPDKSDITDAFAAAYQDNGDLIVYFGADRLANAGDTFLGFWFFKSEVAAEMDGTFSGEHTDGDTLVLVNFPQASKAVPLIQIVQWDRPGGPNGTGCNKADSNNPMPGDCAAKNLRLVAGASGAGAICGAGSDDFCAISNSEGGANDPTPAPWPYTSKDGSVNQFPFETFFEGGINLTQVVGGDACFSSFMAETRSSSSFTAALKDFRLDAFPVCAISATKACTNPRLNDAEDMIVYDIGGAVTNDGFGAVHNITVTDSPEADQIDFVDCQNPQMSQDPSSLGALDSICYTGTITVALNQNGLQDTVTATANTASDNSGTLLTAMATADCPVLQISPELSVTKVCVSSVMVMDVKVVAQVDVNGEVCNIGDSMVTDVTVEDDKAGVLLSGVTLVAPDDPGDPGGTEGACQTYTGMYTPSEANDSNGNATTDPAAVVFKDTVTASGTDIFGFTVTPQPVMAMCPLCP